MLRSIRESRRCTLAAGLAGAVAMALTAVPVFAAATHVSGRIKIVGTVTIVSNIPSNVPITGFANARWNAFVSESNGSQTQSQGVSASATLTRSGDTAVLMLDIPYRFDFVAPPSKVTVQFEASANNLAASTVFDIPLPADGAVTKVALGVSL